jgi:hypothetical protein
MTNGNIKHKKVFFKLSSQYFHVSCYLQNLKVFCNHVTVPWTGVIGLEGKEILSTTKEEILHPAEEEIVQIAGEAILQPAGGQIENHPPYQV